MSLTLPYPPAQSVEPAPGHRFEWQPALERVSELIRASWAKPCWNYDIGLLELHIRRPSGDPELAVGQITDTGRLVSFQAYMPFDVEYSGRRYRAVFASFLTVAPDLHGHGLAGPQQAALVERAIEKGYDLYLTMCEVGAPSNRAVEKVFARKGREARVINVLRYLAGVRPLIRSALPGSPSGRTRTYRRDDRGRVLELVRSLGRGTDLRKVVPAEDVDFLFHDRPHTRTYVYEENGRIRALANLLLLEVVKPRGGRDLNVYFDNVAFGDLDADEQKRFVSDVLLALEDNGYCAAFVPDIGYVSHEPFLAHRFRTAPRALNLYAIPLRDDVMPEGVPDVRTFYLDVY